MRYLDLGWQAEFVGAIVRSSAAKFRRLLGLHDKFLWVMKHHILDHEKVRIADDLIIANLSKPAVQTVFAK